MRRFFFDRPPLEEENWKKERAMFLFTYPTIFVRARSSGGKRERLLGRREGKGGGGGGRMEGVGGLEKLQTALLGVEEERGLERKRGKGWMLPGGMINFSGWRTDFECSPISPSK